MAISRSNVDFFIDSINVITEETLHTAIGYFNHKKTKQNKNKNKKNRHGY